MTDDNRRLKTVLGLLVLYIYIAGAVSTASTFLLVFDLVGANTVAGLSFSVSVAVMATLPILNRLHDSDDFIQ